MIRIFNSTDMVVILDTDTWDVQKFAFDKAWYQYNMIDTPITYSIYHGNPERPLVLDHPYTKFADIDGNKFGDDLALQNYLDEILGKKEASYQTLTRGNDTALKTSDVSNEILLTDILQELKKMNVQLSLITDDEISM